MTLRNLELFIKGDPTRDWIVDKYLKRGHQLNLDPQTLKDHPLEENFDLYLQYGKVATNVKIIGGSGMSLVRLISCFKNASQMSLFSTELEVEFISCMTMLPWRLCELHIEECDISFLVSWIRFCRNDLESLYLANVKWSSEYQYELSQTIFAKMKFLTMVDSGVPGVSSPFSFINCPSLQKLHVDVKSNFWREIRVYDQITSLTIPSPVHPFGERFKEISSFKKLQHLEILEAIPRKYAKDIEELGLKSVKVTYE